MVPKINEIRVKSILTKTAFPDDDFCINPYSGCLFGCSYCFAADFMKRFQGHLKDRWGDYVDIKINGPEILKMELERLSNKLKKSSYINTLKKGRCIKVVIGSVTDPYQGVEAKYKITRKCLEVISNFQDIPVSFNICTKSHLIMRDIDILKKMKNVSVGFTITTTDDGVSRILEGNSPPASLRLKALNKLQKARISTFVMVNPLLPHFIASDKSLKKLFSAIWKTGNREIWLEHINLSKNKLKTIIKILKEKCPKMIKYYIKCNTQIYKNKLNRLIFEILKDY